MAGVFARRGVDAWVFRGDDGLDELTTTTTSQVWAVDGGEVAAFIVDPDRFGLGGGTAEGLRGGDAAYNADVVRRLVAGEPGPVRDAVLLNAGAALAVHAAEPGSPDDRLAAGIERARAAVDAGAAGGHARPVGRASARPPDRSEGPPGGHPGRLDAMDAATCAELQAPLKTEVPGRPGDRAHAAARHRRLLRPRHHRHRVRLGGTGARRPARGHRRRRLGRLLRRHAARGALACAGVTLRSVATVMGLDVRSALADGRTGSSTPAARSAWTARCRSGSATSVVTAELDTDADDATLARLADLDRALLRRGAVAGHAAADRGTPALTVVRDRALRPVGDGSAALTVHRVAASELPAASLMPEDSRTVKYAPTLRLLDGFSVALRPSVLSVTAAATGVE